MYIQLNNPIAKKRLHDIFKLTYQLFNQLGGFNMLPNTSIAPIAIYAWLFIQLLLFIFVVYVGFKVIQMANYTKKIHNQ